MSSVNQTLSKRAQKALQTRRRMRDSARELFISDGYPQTTMQQIADRADVAVQTLYYTFQTKGKLLIELVEVAAAGEDDPVPVPQREWYLEMMASTDAQRILALVVEHGTAIYERVAPLWPVITTALSDADVAAYWDSVATNRHRAQRAQVARIADLGSLKPGLSVQRAGDLSCLLAGHAPYRAFVEEAGWPMVEYKAWLFATLVDQLLDTTSINPGAVEDVSFADLI